MSLRESSLCHSSFSINARARADAYSQSGHLLPAHHELLNDLVRRSDDASPTHFHLFLARLEGEERLLRCYTQNIDGLEGKAGLDVGIRSEAFKGRTGSGNRARSNPRKKVVEKPSGESDLMNADMTVPLTPPSPTLLPLPNLGTDLPFDPHPHPHPQPRSHRVIPLHGQLNTLICALCKYVIPITPHLPLPGNPIPCPSCHDHATIRTALSERARPVGALRANVVLYGEEHPQGESIGSIVERDLRGTGRKGEKEGKADMLLVAGTSLAVPGVKRIVKEMSRALSTRSGLRTVFINNEPPIRGNAEWEGVFDVWVKGDVQRFVTDVLDNPAYWTPPTLPRTPRKRKAPGEPSTPISVSGSGSGLSTPSTSGRYRSSIANKGGKKYGDSSDFTTPTRIPKHSVYLPTPESTPGSELGEVLNEGNQKWETRGKSGKRRKKGRGDEDGVFVGRLDFGCGVRQKGSLTPVSDTPAASGEDPFVALPS
jgi:NAD-dependent histone deacetylase SIR2